MYNLYWRLQIKISEKVGTMFIKLTIWKSSIPICSTLYRMIEGHIRMDNEFNREAASALCQRGAQRVDGGGYQFTRDLRAKTVRNKLSLCLYAIVSLLTATAAFLAEGGSWVGYCIYQVSAVPPTCSAVSCCSLWYRLYWPFACPGPLTIHFCVEKVTAWYFHYCNLHDVPPWHSFWCFKIPTN